jgi:hypothetical protein
MEKSNPQSLRANPFALMMSPDAVFAALERTDRLSRLQGRICRPLDTISVRSAAADAMARFDTLVDDEPDAPLRDDADNVADTGDTLS